MIASDLMTTKLVTVTADTPLATAVHLMVDHRISGLPVVDGAGSLAGVITEGDLMRRAELGTDRNVAGWFATLFGSGRQAEDFVHAHGLRVGDVMTRAPIVCAPSDPLEKIVEVIVKRGIRRLIVTAAGRPVGLVSRADIIRALAAIFDARAERREAVAPDRLAAMVEERLSRQGWAPRATIGVSVEGSALHLRGAIHDERQRDAIRALVAEAAPGWDIVDDLAWIEPLTGSVMRLPVHD